MAQALNISETGRRAFFAGLKPRDNPFSIGSQARSLWAKGWRSARDGKDNPTPSVVHFHKSDDRFCGDKTQFRCFSTDPNEITCRACMKRDTFVISPSGAAYLASLDGR